VYATPSDLLTRFGAEELAQRADRAVPRLVSGELLAAVIAAGDLSSWSAEEQAAAVAGVVVLERALRDADQTIDGYLASRYAVPLSPVPGVVQRLASDIARYFLFDDVVTELVEKRYQAAVAFLKDVQAGKASFGTVAEADSGEATSVPAIPVKVRSSRRVFGDEFLERFK